MTKEELTMNVLSKVAIATIAFTTLAAPTMAASNASHAHLGHVATQWHDTPQQVGLITIAQQENQVALTHANISATKLDDLKWMKTHAAHVIHALDPSVIKKGPGHGYGLIKAAQGVQKHINIAAKQPDASQALKTHAVHVATSASNSIGWAEQALTLSQTLLTADSTSEAAALTQKIASLLSRSSTGFDANNDGGITWHAGEGGLKQSLKHTKIIMKIEKL